MLRKDLTFSKTVELSASPARVWEALTNPELVKKYFFGTTIASSWKVGEPVTFTGTVNGKPHVDKGVILRSEPEKALSFSYFSVLLNLEDKEENYTVITYVISRRPSEKSSLRLSQSGFADEQALANSVRVWDGVLQELKAVVEKP
jgi:uncharacterized protein YndB with AHSA1/START domain